MSASDLFKWFEGKGHLRYKKDEEGDGCVFWLKRLLTDMKKDNWFDLDSEPAKSNFKKLDSFKKGTKFGDNCYIKYGIGTFY